MLSCQVIVSIKEAVARYVINHCAESFGVAPERLSNKQVRDYCYAASVRTIPLRSDASIR